MNIPFGMGRWKNKQHNRGPRPIQLSSTCINGHALHPAMGGNHGIARTVAPGAGWYNGAVQHSLQACVVTPLQPLCNPHLWNRLLLELYEEQVWGLISLHLLCKQGKCSHIPSGDGRKPPLYHRWQCIPPGPASATPLQRSLQNKGMFLHLSWGCIATTCIAVISAPESWMRLGQPNATKLQPSHESIAHFQMKSGQFVEPSQLVWGDTIYEDLIDIYPDLYFGKLSIMQVGESGHYKWKKHTHTGTFFSSLMGAFWRWIHSGVWEAEEQELTGFTS